MAVLNDLREAFMAWGGFLDKLMDKIPIQGRIERWKNERENLLKEKKDIEKLKLDISKDSDREKAMRYTAVIERIAYLDQLLRNKS